MHYLEPVVRPFPPDYQDCEVGKLPNHATGAGPYDGLEVAGLAQLPSYLFEELHPFVTQWCFPALGCQKIISVPRKKCFLTQHQRSCNLLRSVSLNCDLDYAKAAIRFALTYTKG
jgi:hypothetical protein